MFQRSTYVDNLHWVAENIVIDRSRSAKSSSPSPYLNRPLHIWMKQSAEDFHTTPDHSNANVMALER